MKASFLVVLFWNEKAEQLDSLKPDDLIEVECTLHADESKEGKWYNKVQGRSFRVIQKCKQIRDAETIKQLEELIGTAESVNAKIPNMGADILRSAKAFVKNSELPESNRDNLLGMIADRYLKFNANNNQKQ